MKIKHLFATKIIVILMAAIAYIVFSGNALVLAAPVTRDADGGSTAPVDTSANCTGEGANKVCFCPESDPDCRNDAVFQNCEKGDKQNFKNCVLNNDLFKKYLNPFIRMLTFMVGIAVAIGIIVGAIIYASSAGDPQKAATGKVFIRNAIIALLVYFVLFAALQFLLPGDILKTQITG